MMEHNRALLGTRGATDNKIAILVRPKPSTTKATLFNRAFN